MINDYLEKAPPPSAVCEFSTNPITHTRVTQNPRVSFSTFPQRTEPHSYSQRPRKSSCLPFVNQYVIVSIPTTYNAKIPHSERLMLRILSINLPKSDRPFVTTVHPMAKISDSIIQDHKELKTYYGNIKSAKDDDTKTRWRNQFVWELARHSIAEELVVYPAMEKYIKPDGHDMAEKDRQEHQVVSSFRGVIDSQVKVLLYELQDMNVSKPEFDPLLEKLIKSLNEHIDEEEVHLTFKFWLSLMEIERRPPSVGESD